MFFSCDFEVLGEVKSHELTEGGATKQVTEQNKNEYIELVFLMSVWSVGVAMMGLVPLGSLHNGALREVWRTK